jgi:hypothetical protein
MGALSFSFMSGGESLQVGTPWGWSGTSNFVNVDVTNTGGAVLTVSGSARVNNTLATVTLNSGSLTLQPKAVASLKIQLPTGWNFTQGYSYTITLVTANNKEFPTTGVYNP